MLSPFSNIEFGLAITKCTVNVLPISQKIIAFQAKLFQRKISAVTIFIKWQLSEKL